MKILFVCTGNTCRSPMAQGLARAFFPPGIEILSAGVNAFQQDPVSQNAVKVLKEKGIDISDHTAVRVNKGILDSADYVFTMTKSQERYLRKLYPEYIDKIASLGGWSGSGEDISDPWGGSVQAYKQCAMEIEELLLHVAEKLGIL